MDHPKTPNGGPKMPVSALSAESIINNAFLKIEETPAGGKMLGIIKPIWTKALESEKRLAWLLDMENRDLVVSVKSSHYLSSTDDTCFIYTSKLF